MNKCGAVFCAIPSAALLLFPSPLLIDVHNIPEVTCFSFASHHFHGLLLALALDLCGLPRGTAIIANIAIRTTNFVPIALLGATLVFIGLLRRRRR